MDFYGDQPGRWRVSAVAGFLESEKSPWREFSFKTGSQAQNLAPHAPVQSSSRSKAAGDTASQDLRLEWMPVPGAESYAVEIDAFGGCAPQQWCSEVGKSVIVEGLKETALTRNLPNAERVRWRVWAVSGARQTQKSGWQVLSLNGAVAPRPTEQNRGVGLPSLGVLGPVYSVGGAVTQPRVVYRVDPSYPEPANADHVTGTVSLRVIVAEDGSVKDAHIIRGVRSDLDQAALESVRSWLFEPATKDGKPVAVWSQIDVKFDQQ
jgi:TonB family protein